MKVCTNLSPTFLQTVGGGEDFLKLQGFLLGKRADNKDNCGRKGSETVKQTPQPVPEPYPVQDGAASSSPRSPSAGGWHPQGTAERPPETPEQRLGGGAGSPSSPRVTPAGAGDTSPPAALSRADAGAGSVPVCNTDGEVTTEEFQASLICFF